MTDRSTDQIRDLLASEMSVAPEPHPWGDVEQRAAIGPPLPNQAFVDVSRAGVWPAVLPHDSPLGPRLITTTPNQLLAWNLDHATWPDIACSTAGRNLTLDEWASYGPDEPYRATCDQYPTADTTPSS